MGGWFRWGNIAALVVTFLWALSCDAVAAEKLEGEKKTILYAHEGINIRGGPGLKHEIIGRLGPGDAAQIARTQGEWGEVVRKGGRGWVLLTLLKEETIPPLQIVNWEWRKAPRMGRRGVVVWVVEVRNNTDLPVDHVQVEFRTFDRKGNLLDAAVTHLRGIRPGKIAGSRSFAGYSGREASAQVNLLLGEGDLRVGKK